MIFNERPTKAHLFPERLRANVLALKASLRPGADIMAVVKADAYGHGATTIARILEGAGLRRFAVATAEEGVRLREAGVDGQVFVLNGWLASAEIHHHYRLIPVVSHLDDLKRVADAAGRHPLPIVLKFDTGMGRLGLMPAETDAAVRVLAEEPTLETVCVMTHLASADEAPESVPLQFQRYDTILQKLRANGAGRPFATSACNSAAVLDGQTGAYDWARVGLALYGASPHPRLNDKIFLQPVLELKTRFLTLKTLPVGHGVGYGASFVTKRPTRVGILPLGYGDGYPWSLANKGQVLVAGRRAPVIGRVSMDSLAVDVTDVPAANAESVVTLIGRDGGEEIRVEELALLAGTLPYEILCRISSRVPRILS